LLSIKFVNLKDFYSKLAIRFKLRDSSEQQEPLLLLPVIQPVTIVDELLKVPCNRTGTSASIGAPAKIACYTCPDGERFDMQGIEVFRTGGDGTAIALYVQRQSIDAMFLQWTPTASSHAEVLPSPITLNPGDVILVYVDVVTAAGTWTVNLLGKAEELD